MPFSSFTVVAVLASSLLLIIGCFTLWNIPYGSKDVNSTVNTWNCLEVSDNGRRPKGSGIKSIYVPYYINNYNTIDLISNSGARCTLDISDNDLDPNLSFEVYQVSPTVLLLRGDVHKNKILISVNMSTCASIDLKTKIKQQTDLYWIWGDDIIQYEDGFDVIIHENRMKVRVSYDTKGNQIGQPRLFQNEIGRTQLHPISQKSRKSNLIAKYLAVEEKVWKTVISLIDRDGRFIKKLLSMDEFGWFLEYPRQDIGDSLYTLCNKHVGNIIECVQYDELGNEIYRNSTETTEGLIAVSNLKEGGIVLFTDTNETEQDTRIHATEMRPGNVTRTTYSIAKKQGDKFFVTDFNEVQRQFTVRRETDLDHGYSVCSHTFSLPKLM